MIVEIWRCPFNELGQINKQDSLNHKDMREQETNKPAWIRDIGRATTEEYIILE